MLAVAERTDHPRSVKHRAVRSQQKPAFGGQPALYIDHDRQTAVRCERLQNSWQQY
jgi:hypothetical protein